MPSASTDPPLIELDARGVVVRLGDGRVLHVPFIAGGTPAAEPPTDFDPWQGQRRLRYRVPQYKRPLNLYFHRDTSTPSVPGADFTSDIAVRVYPNVYGAATARAVRLYYFTHRDTSTPAASATDATMGVTVIVYPTPYDVPAWSYLRAPATDVDVLAVAAPAETPRSTTPRTIPQTYRPRPSLFFAPAADVPAPAAPEPETPPAWTPRPLAAKPPGQFQYLFTPATDVDVPAAPAEDETPPPWRARTLPLAYQPPTFFAPHTGDEAGAAPAVAETETVRAYMAARVRSVPYVIAPYRFGGDTSIADAGGAETPVSQAPRTVQPQRLKGPFGYLFTPATDVDVPAPPAEAATPQAWAPRPLPVAYRPHLASLYLFTPATDFAAVQPIVSDIETNPHWRARTLPLAYQPPTFFSAYTGDLAGVEPAGPSAPETNPHFAGQIIRSEYDANPWLYWMGSGVIPEEAEAGQTWQARPLPNAYRPQPRLFLFSRDTATPDAGGAETPLSWVPKPVQAQKPPRAAFLYLFTPPQDFSGPAEAAETGTLLSWQPRPLPPAWNARRAALYLYAATAQDFSGPVAEPETLAPWAPQRLWNLYRPRPWLVWQPATDVDVVTPAVPQVEGGQTWHARPLPLAYGGRAIAIRLYTTQAASQFSAPRPPAPTARRRKTPQWMRREELLGVRW